MQRDAYYNDFSPAVAEQLSDSDVATLGVLEDGWESEASTSLPSDTFSAAEAEWAIWKGKAPEYRLLAYYDNFGGFTEDVPTILTGASGWNRDTAVDPALNQMFDKVDTALAVGSGGEVSGPPLPGAAASGGTIAGFSGLGMLVGAAAVLWFLSKKR